MRPVPAGFEGGLVGKLRETPIFLAQDPKVGAVKDPQMKRALLVSAELLLEFGFKQVQCHYYSPEIMHSGDTLWPQMLAALVSFIQSRSCQISLPAQVVGNVAGWLWQLGCEATRTW